MGTRIKDFESRKNIQQPILAAGMIGAVYPSRGENYFQIVVQGSACIVQPEGRLKGQSGWTAIGTAITGPSTGIGTKADVRGYDEIRFNCTTFLVNGSLIASGFWD